MDDFITNKELAELCRTTEASVRFWRHNGTGPRGARIGKKVLYRRSDVDAWIEERYAAGVGGIETEVSA